MGLTRRWGAHPALGIWIALLSAATFGTSGAFGKSLIQAGWTPAALVTVRVAGAALLLLPLTLLAMRGRWSSLRGNVPLVLGYGLAAVAGCQLAYFYAVSHLSVGVALLLEYLAPILIVAWLWARHGHRPRPLTVAGVVLAIGGLLLVLDVMGGVRVSMVGVIWGLVAAVGLVIYFLIAAHDGDGALPPIALAGFGLLVGATSLVVAGLLRLVPMRMSFGPVHVLGSDVPWWVPAAELVVVAAAIAYVTGIAGVRLLGSKLASFVSLTEVLFAVVFAWLLLGELPGPVQLLGGLLIVAGVVAVRVDELRGTTPVGGAAPPGGPGERADDEVDFVVPTPVP